MPQIGPLELIVVAVIALVVFGPRRLPEMARNVGKAMNEFKRQAADLKGQFDADLKDEAVTADAPPGPGTVVPEPMTASAATPQVGESGPPPIAAESVSTTPATATEPIATTEGLTATQPVKTSSS